ncbi:hypothetical protein CCZ01_10030, partial [Helicobacter monodelphidis]
MSINAVKNFQNNSLFNHQGINKQSQSTQHIQTQTSLLNGQDSLEFSKKAIDSLESKTNTSLNNNPNIAKERYEAVDKKLGYGVDADGYFTSDFNEKAGIPKDFRIRAADMQKFV